MDGTRRFGSLAVALASGLAACAPAADVFDVHQAAQVQAAREAATEDERDCGVVVANDTDQYLDVQYVVAGMRSELGVVPSGQWTGFNVLCAAGTVDAFGVVTMEGLYSGSREFRTRARLDRTTVTMLRFTELHAVR